MNEPQMSYVGVYARQGHEDEAKKIMGELGYEGDSPWMVGAGGSFPVVRERLIERLNKTDWEWEDSLDVGDLPDHPDAGQS